MRENEIDIKIESSWYLWNLETINNQKPILHCKSCQVWNPARGRWGKEDERAPMLGNCWKGIQRFRGKNQPLCHIHMEASCNYLNPPTLILTPVFSLSLPKLTFALILPAPYWKKLVPTKERERKRERNNRDFDLFLKFDLFLSLIQIPKHRFWKAQWDYRLETKSPWLEMACWGLCYPSQF